MKDIKDLNLNELLKEVWDALIEAREDANYELYNDNSPGAKEHWTSKITNLTQLSDEVLRRIEKGL